MAKAMTPDQFLAQLRKWGVIYKEHTVDGVNWKEHHRPGSWGNIHGLVVHHTGDDAPDTADFNVLWHGRSDLEGPLCHWGMDDEGVVQLIGWGRASHAGVNASNVWNAVIAESYTLYPPAPGVDDTDGNAISYGQETMYSGNKRMTDKAYESSVRVAAAVIDFHGWSEKSVVGHKEVTHRKIDPASLDMHSFRTDIRLKLLTGPSQPVSIIVPLQLAPRETTMFMVKDSTSNDVYILGGDITATGRCKLHKLGGGPSGASVANYHDVIDKAANKTIPTYDFSPDEMDTLGWSVQGFSKDYNTP